MRIAFVLNHFLPQQTAGTEIYVWKLSRELMAVGVEVQVFIPNYLSEISESYVYDGITVVKYAEPSKPDRALIMGKKRSKGIEFFTKEILNYDPSIVHFHEIAGSNGISVSHLEAIKSLSIKVIYTMHLATATCKTGNLMYCQSTVCDGIISIKKCSYCALQKRLNNAPIAATINTVSMLLYRLGINPNVVDHSLGTLLGYPRQIADVKDRLKRIENACDVLVPITQWYKNILLNNNVADEKITLVLQALPTQYTSTLPAKPLAALPLKLIFIGRINHLKGVDMLLDVVKTFSPQQLQLSIYGATDDEAFLSKCVEQTKQFEHIQWKGKLQQEEVLPTIATHHALILPSIFSEMSPLVIQEAFAAGVPVIGSNVSGIAEQVKDNINGRLFLYKDKQSLKEVLAHIVDNMQLINEYRSNIPGVRTFNVIGEEVLKIYQSLN